MIHTRKEIATSFLRMVATGDVDRAYDKYVGPGFIHHNPYFPGAATSLMTGMKESAKENPHKVFEVKRVIAEEEMVTTYSHIKQHPDDLGGAVVHIFRFENDLIVELWDVGQQIPEDSPNENGMF